MLDIAITLLLLFICVLICAVFGAAGFFIGLRLNYLQRPKKPPDESKQAEILKKKAKREFDNFYNYTGDEQE